MEKIYLGYLSFWRKRRFNLYIDNASRKKNYRRILWPLMKNAGPRIESTGQQSWAP